MSKKITVMVAGLSNKPDQGKMARMITEAILEQEDMTLYPCALAEDLSDLMWVNSSTQIQLISMGGHQHILELARANVDVIAEFTSPKSVNRNLELYCQPAIGIRSVIGTTGGDRQKLIETVMNSNTSSVIAPNMSPAVVILIAMIKYAGVNFKGAFEGFKLVIRESHQSTKKDTSGTAISLLEDFAALGVPLRKEQIQIIRDPEYQETKLGIPKKFLGGHGYHTYTLVSPDGTVLLQFTHNVLGRSVYIDGALKSIRFLAQPEEDMGLILKILGYLAMCLPKTGKAYTMIDVLKGIK